MTFRRYRKYSAEVNHILDFVRATRRIATQHPDDVCAADILQHIDRFASNYAWDLLDIVLDHEERQARFVARWREWRTHRRSQASCRSK